MWLINAFNYNYEMKPKKAEEKLAIKERLKAREVRIMIYHNICIEKMCFQVFLQLFDRCQDFY